jgi:hypothetical protein
MKVIGLIAHFSLYSLLVLLINYRGIASQTWTRGSTVLAANYGQEKKS